MLRFRSYLLFALLTSFVIGVAYFGNTQPTDNDTLSSTVIPEIADYARDVEDASDDNPLFINTSVLSQQLQLDWGNVLNTYLFKPSLTGLYYRALPRSPPVKS